MKPSLLLCCAALMIPGCKTTKQTVTTPPLYANDFQSAEVGNVPEDFLVLDGQFAVVDDGDNKSLELPGAPLDTFGVLFGPPKQDGARASARIYSTNNRRRFPAFGVGLNGVGGFRLQVSAAKRKLELLKGDDTVQSVDFKWTPGAWTHLELQTRKTGDTTWTVEGRAWHEGSPKPGTWMVTAEDSEEPYAGKASVWGQPYAGTPIRFDDLKVVTAE